MSAAVASVRDIDPSRLDLDDLAAHFRTDLDAGLTSRDAAQRLAADGPNELRAAPPIPQWRKLVRQFKDPLIYLLLGAVVVSTAVWLVEGREGLPIDALVIATVVLLVTDAGQQTDIGELLQQELNDQVDSLRDFIEQNIQ